MTASPNSTLPVLRDLPTTQAAPFRRLRMRHRQVLALHCAGMPNSEIDTTLGRGAGYAASVLRNDAVRPVLEALYRDYETEMRGLFPLAVEALRTHLANLDGNVALRAADLLFKVTGRYAQVEGATLTAEDIVERVLERVAPDGTRQTLSLKRIVRSVVQKVDTPSASDPESAASGDLGSEGEPQVSRDAGAVGLLGRPDLAPTDAALSPIEGEAA